ncbi:MAG TPA: hypothetical protein DER60_10210 [Syntrophomonas sp.]|nr:hypothetical protein [Syntrophomonas sp.]
MPNLFQRRLTLFYLLLIVAVMAAMGVILNMVIKRGSFDASMDKFLLTMVLATVAVGIVAALINIWIAAQMSRPIEIITAGVDNMAQGNLRQRIHLLPSDELHHLGQSINELAETLEHNLIEISSVRNRLALVLDTTINGIFTVSQYGRVTYMNRVASKILGLGPEELGKKHSEVIQNYTLIDLIDKVRTTHQPVRCEIKFHSHLDRLLEVNVVPLRAGLYGREEGTLAIFNDITELKRLERVRKDFVGNISHELLTPVTTSTGYAENLMNCQGMDREQIRQKSAVIYDEANRLQRLISRLMELSRIESGRLQLHLQTLDISEIIEKSISMSRRDHEQEIWVDFNKPTEPLMVDFDEELIVQVILNLLDNAVKYSPPNTPVVITVEDQPEEVKVTVSNQGEGIPPQEKERIFERFYRIDKDRSRDTGGFGLGLSIVKHLVEHHNGKLGVESELGRGATFYFTLPHKIETGGELPQ